MISRAKEYINTENIALEDVLQNVEKNRIKAVEDREEAERLKEEIEKLKVEYDEKLEKLVSQRDKMIEKLNQKHFQL